MISVGLATLVSGCVIAILILGFPSLRLRRTQVFLALLIPAIVLRLSAVYLGNNYDMYEWAKFVRCLADGKDLYADTDWIYPPLWGYVLLGLNCISGNQAGADLTHFHLYVSAILTIADVGIATLLHRRFGVVPAMIYLFSPVSILISGYHGQFDNIAILLAFLSWRILVRRSSLKTQQLLLAGLLLGLSLATKHIFFLFPILLLFTANWRRWRDRFIVSGLSLSIFGLSFMPWMFRPAARSGVLAHVFQAHLNWGNSLMSILIQLFLPSNAVNALMWWSPAFAGAQSVFFLGLAGIGATAILHKKDLFVYYLLGMLICTSFMALQYLVIPLIVCCIYRRAISLWLYMIVATGVLLGPIWSPPNLAGSMTDLAGGKTFLLVYGLSFAQAQIWLLIFLAARILGWRRLARQKPRPTVILGWMPGLKGYPRSRYFAATCVVALLVIILNLFTAPFYRQNRSQLRTHILREIAEYQSATAIEAWRQGNSDLAIKCLKKALEVSQTSGKVWTDAAEIVLALGNTEAADAYIRQALGQSNTPETVRRLAQMCYRRGMYQEAARCSEALLRVSPLDTSNIQNLGNALQALNRPTEANALMHMAQMLTAPPSSSSTPASLNQGGGTKLILSSDGRVEIEQ